MNQYARSGYLNSTVIISLSMTIVELDRIHDCCLYSGRPVYRGLTVVVNALCYFCLDLVIICSLTRLSRNLMYR